MLVIEFGTEGTIEMVWVCRDGYQQLQALAISHRHRFADGNLGLARAQQLLSPDRISGGGVDLPCNPGTPPVRSGWWGR